MFTLILCIVFMVIGYALGREETDKKWIGRLKDSDADMIVYRDGTVEVYKNGEKI